MEFMDNIIHKLIEKIKEHPDRLAIVAEKTGRLGFRSRKAVKFGELYNDMVSTAEWLKDKGVKKGDKILLFIPMSYDLYRVIMSINYIGATVVFVDAWANKERLEQAIDITGANVFIGSVKAQILRLLSPVIRRKIPIKIVYDNFLIKKSRHNMDDFTSPDTKGDDAALITFTTGSTGTPKGAVRTHKFLLKQHEVLSAHLKLRDEDVDFVTLPIFVLNNLASGITSVVADFNPAKPGELNPARIVSQIKRNGVTTAIGSTATIASIENYCSENGVDIEFDSLFVGGSPVYPSVANKLVSTFHDARVEVVYGSTEAEPIGGIDANVVAKSSCEEGLLLGPKVSDIEVAIVKPSDDPLTGPISSLIAYDEVGEIVVAGEHVLEGYLNREETFKKNKIVDGKKIWHRTGDAGMIDGDGNIRLFGRVKNRIQLESRLIYTLPLEKRLLEIKEVNNGTIVEVGEKRYVVVETDVDSVTDLVDNAVNEVYPDLTDFSIRIVERIPRDPRHDSKIDYDKLKVMLRDC
jgi:acyl-coenzyme A synthetase/AMP-(fatty) acid ligase